MASEMLMNVVFTTLITATGGNSFPMQSSVTSFETYDERGCETTAKMLLGVGANVNQGKWYLKSTGIERTVICFPKAADQKGDVNRGSNRE